MRSDEDGVVTGSGSTPFELLPEPDEELLLLLPPDELLPDELPLPEDELLPEFVPELPPELLPDDEPLSEPDEDLFWDEELLLFLPDELPPEPEELPDALLLVSVVSADEVLVVVVALELSDFAEVVPVVF